MNGFEIACCAFFLAGLLALATMCLIIGRKR